MIWRLVGDDCLLLLVLLRINFIGNKKMIISLFLLLFLTLFTILIHQLLKITEAHVLEGKGGEADASVVENAVNGVEDELARKRAMNRHH